MRKSTVGPWIAVAAPPAYSNCTTFLPPRSADCPIDSAWGTVGVEGAGAVGERRAVDVERVVGRPVDARPGAGRQAVPAGTGVGRCLGEQATIRGRRSLLQEFGHRRHVAAASVASRELLDEILAQSVSDEQEDRSVVPVAPVVVAAVAAVRAGPGGGTDRRHGERGGGAGEPDRDGQTTLKRWRAHEVDPRGNRFARSGLIDSFRNYMPRLA